MKRRNPGLMLLVATLTLASPLPAQSARAWKVVGDTTGAPIGCSAKAAIATIDRWFTAFNRADSAQLAGATAPFFVFSTGKHWVANDRHIRIDSSIARLVDYVRERR